MRTDIRTDGRMSGNSPLCPTGHRPFGAAAQKGKIRIRKEDHQETTEFLEEKKGEGSLGGGRGWLEIAQIGAIKRKLREKEKFCFEKKGQARNSIISVQTN